MNDADLVARARRGDAEAFGELVERHQRAVYRAALAALGLPADAEDAAQDALLLAYRRLDSFRGDASFKTWLLTITWHQAINRRRRLTSVWRRLIAAATGDEEESAIANIAAAGPSPEEAAGAGQLRDGIREAIRALSPKLRDALLLAQAGEYSYEEIGAMLHVPLGTIKWRVSEGRRIVRKRLQERGTSMLDDELNAAVDDVARRMTDEPSAAGDALRRRVLTRIAAREAPRTNWRTLWWLAPMAAALIAVGLLVTRDGAPTPHAPAPTGAITRSQQDRPHLEPPGEPSDDAEPRTPRPRPREHEPERAPAQEAIDPLFVAPLVVDALPPDAIQLERLEPIAPIDVAPLAFTDDQRRLP